MKLKWDQIGQKRYESGVDRGVYYPLDSETGEYTPGVAWNGLISVSETPEGAEPESSYADNIKYLTMLSAEELKGKIEAYTYPDEFAASDGSAELTPGVYIGQQARQPFGLCYRTKVGDDVKGQDAGYKLHLVYGCQCSPSERTYETMNDSPEAITLSWEFSTTPVGVEGHNPTALLTVDSTKVDAASLSRLEEVLYGADTAVEGTDAQSDSAPRLPLPDEVAAILIGSTSLAMRARMAGRKQ